MNDLICVSLNVRRYIDKFCNIDFDVQALKLAQCLTTEKIV